MPATPALVIEDLSKYFGGLQAISQLSFTVAPGERRALLGPNGAGKTTLFNMITGLMSPSSGRIVVFGQDVSRLPSHRRTQLGLARTFQITTLFPELTVLENVLLAVQAGDGARFAIHRPRHVYRHLFDRAEALLKAWGLGDRQDVRTRELSYGEQRQVEIVLALASTPRVLLLDEPTAGLSQAETAQVSSMVSRLSRDVTILRIEHDMDVTFAIADRITVLFQGRVLAEGTPEAIRQNAEVAEIYLGTDED